MEKEKTNRQNNKPPSEKKPVKNFLRYSGLGFQMLATILLGVLIGQGLDYYVELNKPWFTVVFTVLFVLIALFNVVREIIKE